MDRPRIILTDSEEREEIRAARRAFMAESKQRREWHKELERSKKLKKLGLRPELDTRRQFVLYARQFRVPPLTLDEVARHLDISRERVRQLEKDALRSLRASWTKHHAKGEEL